MELMKFEMKRKSKDLSTSTSSRKRSFNVLKPKNNAPCQTNLRSLILSLSVISRINLHHQVHDNKLQRQIEVVKTL